MKYTYTLDDDATFYFIVDSDALVHAWSDDKKLVDAYMQFRKCPKLKVKKVYMPYRQLVPVLNEHLHNEVIIAPLVTQDEKGKVITISCPMTQSELELILEYTDSFMSIVVNYNILDDAMKRLKKKYRDALCMFNLDIFIDKEVYNKHHRWLETLQIDQVKLFVKTFADFFG